jgi:hypothetical protein
VKSPPWPKNGANFSATSGANFSATRYFAMARWQLDVWLGVAFRERSEQAKRAARHGVNGTMRKFEASLWDEAA